MNDTKFKVNKLMINGYETNMPAMLKNTKIKINHFSALRYK